MIRSMASWAVVVVLFVAASPHQAHADTVSAMDAAGRERVIASDVIVDPTRYPVGGDGTAEYVEYYFWDPEKGVLDIQIQAESDLKRGEKLLAKYASKPERERLFRAFVVKGHACRVTRIDDTSESCVLMEVYYSNLKGYFIINYEPIIETTLQVMVGDPDEEDIMTIRFGDIGAIQFFDDDEVIVRYRDQGKLGGTWVVRSVDDHRYTSSFIGLDEKTFGLKWINSDEVKEIRFTSE
jgi:hypothetical protein